MKVFKFYYAAFYYAIAAESLELATDKFCELIGEQPLRYEEIKAELWNDKFINIFESNDRDGIMFKISINDAICGIEPQLIYTNNEDLMN